ncbi:MAG TPA: squalene synthase HpnC, partial [Burkholderiaceae bacterium]
DLADEGDDPPAQRLEALAAYRADLDAVYAGRPVSPRWRPVFDALARTVEHHRLPHALLTDLLSAFSQDVTVTRYADRAALLDYCRRSANPIGRLLLHLYGVHDADALRRSDDICTALQLINFWQDLSVDLPRARNYVPHADAQRHGVSWRGHKAMPDTPAARALVRDLVHWAAALITEGAALPPRIPGRAGWELRLVLHGGWRVLEKIARMDYASMAHRPRLQMSDLPLLLWRCVRYSSAWFSPARLP